METPSISAPQPVKTAEREQAERAAAEVDVQLLELALARSPRERLRVATRAQRALGRLRLDASR
jgi:hypothetical protein